MIGSPKLLLGAAAVRPLASVFAECLLGYARWHQRTSNIIRMACVKHGPSSLVRNVFALSHSARSHRITSRFDVTGDDVQVCHYGEGRERTHCELKNLDHDLQMSFE